MEKDVLEAIEAIRANMAGFETQVKELETTRKSATAADKATIDETLAALRSEIAAMRTEIDTLKPTPGAPAPAEEIGFFDILNPMNWGK